MKENKTEEIYFIARVVGRYFALKRYAVCKECALPWQKVMLDASSQRADILCVDKNLDFVIVETKSSWTDFRTDYKWQAYLDWCNRFYFAADESVAQRIAKDDAVKRSRVECCASQKTGKLRRYEGL